MSDYEKLTYVFRASWGSSMTQLFWYALLASCVWAFFYRVFHTRFRHRRIGYEGPKPKQAVREIFCSLRSMMIFGLVTGAVVYAILSGGTRLYYRVDLYGEVWFVLSIVVMVVVHDTYFYWTHRLMHHPWLYQRFHQTHHRSINPTPWAAYSFSPVEALVQAGIGPLIVFTLPVHPLAFALFMVWQISFNVFGHCGYEIFPRWFFCSPFRYCLNSVTHHALHHEKFQANYSLYFNVWDRLMGTNHADYEERFNRATDLPLKQANVMNELERH